LNGLIAAALPILAACGNDRDHCPGSEVRDKWQQALMQTSDAKGTGTSMTRVPRFRFEIPE
jgi:hypothetical protein